MKRLATFVRPPGEVESPPGAAGTSYIVRRRLPGEGEWSFIGVSGRKEFVDDTLIAGPGVREGIHAPAVQYTVQGQRSDPSGPLSEIFTVNFGQNPGGGVTASVMGAREGNHSPASGGSLGASPSTVEGRIVQKTLPGSNGSPRRSKTRG